MANGSDTGIALWCRMADGADADEVKPGPHSLETLVQIQR